MEVFMCDVALHAMSGRALATLVRAEVVMVETPVTESSIQAGGRTAHPGHARPSPDQEHRGRGDGNSSTWSDRIQVYADAKKYDVLRRIHNAIIVEIRSIL